MKEQTRDSDHTRTLATKRIPRTTVEPNTDLLISPKTLLGIAACALGFGFVVGLKFTLKKNPVAKGTAWMGVKAVLAGTALCMGGAGAVTYGVFKYLGVTNVREFADKMRETVPERADKLREIIQPKEQLGDTLRTLPGFPQKSCPLPPPTTAHQRNEEEDIAQIDEMLVYKDEQNKHQ